MPMPESVKSSRMQAWRVRPSMMWAFFTPPATVPRATAPIRQLYAFERVADLARLVDGITTRDALD